ncbi:hypothetical protein BTJ68_15026 [Hortaea werneckii EXF-2000]|uniref:Uncharacterized protein n=1 Tax=Hortaea werneckii EXF-2000 TaxID=1157616 RepID=A0A1Z5SMP6_HORWE|nr:hypothetical protein BTJ68_15026 [Hortaea werneckii EXF-2000]
MYEMELKPGSKRNMLAMTGVITSTTIKNSIITVLQDMEYIHGQLFERTVESGCGAVTCLPGALTMLRFSAFRRMAKWYFADKAEQISDLFDWGKCHLGEDRWLTHLFMIGARERYQIQMNTGAFCKTEAVQTFKSLLKQRRRWFLGFITNEVCMLTDVRLWRRYPVLLVIRLAQNTIRTTALLFFIMVISIVTTSQKISNLPVGFIAVSLGLNWLLMLYFGAKLGRWKIMLYPLMFVLNPFFNYIYMVYGIFTAGNRTWGGPRADAAIKADEHTTPAEAIEKAEEEGNELLLVPETLKPASAALVLPSDVASDKHKTQGLRNKLLASLSVDGIAAYKLTPNVELLCLADAIVTHPAVLKGVEPARWAKLRTGVCRQRLLSEPSSTLQNLIYDDLDVVEEQLGKLEGSFKEQAQVEFLLERAEVDTHHGLDKIARQNLDEAKQRRRFEYALTGLLGKRTKFQEKDFSQLVVLAKSASNDESGSTETSDAAPGPVEKEETGPAKLDLNDDTLLEPKESESASASERLRYIFQLASPYGWDLEAELAARWVQLGGLRSALEIYERLEMWAEAALCWAATEREDKAKNMIKKQLFHATSGKSDVEADDDETWEGEERQPPPMDAPRLYCILGDIDQDVSMYEKAWTVSKERYARAQRSLGRLYITKGDMVKAAEAYSKSLRVNQLNQQSWFALGCALLELAQFEKAVAAFGRCVQIDDMDAEGWSNLAAALLRCEPDTDDGAKPGAAPADDEDESVITYREKPDPQKHRQDALKALKRAAGLKHDSYRIWENLLIVAASLSPPDYNSALAAQKRIIDIRGKTDGEKCIDKQILEMLASHVITTSDRYDATQPGLPRIFVKFMDESVIPLITGSAELWQLVSKLALWRNKPSSALDAEEKSWRAVTAQPGWETENEKLWNLVVDATVRLCEAYESFGPMERTEGLASGEPVAKDWKFKARSALRGILGKAKGTWEGTDGWERLQETMQGLKA